MASFKVSSAIFFLSLLSSASFSFADTKKGKAIPKTKVKPILSISPPSMFPIASDIPSDVPSSVAPTIQATTFIPTGGASLLPTVSFAPQPKRSSSSPSSSFPVTSNRPSNGPSDAAPPSCEASAPPHPTSVGFSKESSEGSSKRKKKGKSKSKKSGKTSAGSKGKGKIDMDECNDKANDLIHDVVMPEQKTSNDSEGALFNIPPLQSFETAAESASTAGTNKAGLFGCCMLLLALMALF